ncbi:MAG: hypothetical protein JO057_30890 [Chloroflexi bacterium]|nr:hypothetical protein [Chloroflexota bacterium]
MPARSVRGWTLIGPSDQRVFLATDIVGPCPFMSCLQDYTDEQVVFRNAATGQELARSDSLPKMTSGALVTPGDDGAIDYLSLQGTIYQLAVQPAGQAAK